MRFFYVLLFFSLRLVAQQTEIVDFIKVDAEIIPDSKNRTLSGNATYEFRMLTDADSIYLDAHQMKISEYSGVEHLRSEADKIWLLHQFKKNTTYSVAVKYEAKPKQTFYFMPSENEFWTQGQGKYTSHWLPSLDDTNDKMIFNLSYLVPENTTVIANGKLKTKEKKQEAVLWVFEMEFPMASYLVAVAGGNYKNEVLTAHSGTPIALYYKPEDADKVEPTYRHSKEIFDFLEKEIGVPYPWGVYQQVPVRDFLYAGMENTSATFFSEAFLVDNIGFNDRNYINVNAHELAHQWFGNMVTAKSDEHHWLQEGFATYYALLAEKEIFGEDYFYWQLLQYAEILQEISSEGKGESLMNPKASSSTFYQKGAWALHILSEKVGVEAFRIAVKNYLEKYKFQNVTTDQFLEEVKAVSEMDLSDFEENWLRQTAFQLEEVYQSLMQSEFINRYFEVVAMRHIPLRDKQHQWRKILEEGNEYIGQEAVYQLALEPSTEQQKLYKIALNSKNLYIRQAAVFTLETIPNALVADYEKLLDDTSYATQEIAFVSLWNQFPEKRMALLNKMKHRIGFQNKNLHQLWLALAISTTEVNAKDKQHYVEMLTAYTAPTYSFEIREKAFEYLVELDLWNETSLQNLLHACTHPAWRFAKASKTILKSVILNDEYAAVFRQLKDRLDTQQQGILNDLLSEK